MLNLIKRSDFIVGFVASALLLIFSLNGTLPFGMIDVFGFISGAVCVWLVVKKNIWNWPIGMVNNVFFLITFAEAGLFADSALQVFYIVTSAFGWYFWLRGGPNRTEARVRNVGWREFSMVGVAIAAVTYVMYGYLVSINDTAPFLDALTTSGSLGAFYLQSKKYVQSWYLWIAADLVYIPLYFWKDLPLVGVVYMIFLAMCVKGLMDWRADLKTGTPNRKAIEAEVKELIHA